MGSITKKLRTMSEERRLYTLRHLPIQCIQSYELERVQQLLTSFEFIETKIETLQSEDGVNQLLTDYTSAIAAYADMEGIFVSLAMAIQLSATILREDAKQTFPQIHGRLLNASMSALRSLLDGHTPSYPWLCIWSKTMFSTESPLIRTLVGHNANVLDCVISNDAKTVLSASGDHTLRIWNLETGLCEHILRGHTDAVNSCALSADGTLALSASADKTLRLWDTRTGQCLRVFEGHTDKVTSCVLNATGDFFVSSSYDETVRLWDVNTRTSTILTGHEDRVTCCSLSADEKQILSGSYDKTLRLWDRMTYECLMIIQNESGGITGCALNKDGNLALSSSVIYLLEDGDEDEMMDLTIFFDSKGRNLGTKDFSIRDLSKILYDAGIPTEVTQKEAVISVHDMSLGNRLQEFKGHRERINDFDLSKSGKRLITSAGSSEIKIWDIETSQCVATLFEISNSVGSCAIDISGDIALSSSLDGSLHVWSVPRAINRSLSTSEDVGSAIACCNYNQEGNLAMSVSFDKEIRLWNALTGELIAQIKAENLPQFVKFVVCLDHKVAVMTPAFFSLREEETKELSVLDMETGLIHKLSGHTDWLSDCSVDQTGMIAISASLDQTLRIWDITNYTCLHVLEGHMGITCCALSPDGLNALSGSDDTTLRLWDTQTGSCVSILEGHSNKIENCVFSGDGQRALSVGADNALCLWNLANGTLIHKMKSAVNSSFPRPCALDFDGRRAIYAAPRRTLRLIEIETEQEITAFTFDAPINFISFSPGEDNIIIGDGSGHVHFLSIEEGMLADT